jgi:hypothetical protein
MLRLHFEGGDMQTLGFEKATLQCLIDFRGDD